MSGAGESVECLHGGWRFLERLRCVPKEKGPEYILLQDNEPKHTATVIKNRLQPKEEREVLEKTNHAVIMSAKLNYTLLRFAAAKCSVKE